MCFSTTMNTLGMGDVVPAGSAALTGAEQASNSNLGSGDRASGPTASKKTSKKGSKKTPVAVKKAAPNYGAELPYLVYAKPQKK